MYEYLRELDGKALRDKEKGDNRPSCLFIAAQLGFSTNNTIWSINGAYNALKYFTNTLYCIYIKKFCENQYMKY